MCLASGSAYASASRHPPSAPCRGPTASTTRRLPPALMRRQRVVNLVEFPGVCCAGVRTARRAAKTSFIWSIARSTVWSRAPRPRHDRGSCAARHYASGGPACTVSRLTMARSNVFNAATCYAWLTAAVAVELGRHDRAEAQQDGKSTGMTASLAAICRIRATRARKVASMNRTGQIHVDASASAAVDWRRVMRQSSRGKRNPGERQHGDIAGDDSPRAGTAVSDKPRRYPAQECCRAVLSAAT